MSLLVSLVRTYWMPLFALGVAVALLFQMLAPGYVLTLDMAWTPEMPFLWSAELPNNTYLLDALIHALAHVVPAWLVQKAILIGIFFLLLYLPYRFLPYIEDPYARVFAALVYTLNPFVYARMLAGQWEVLLGYALLPLFLCALVQLTRRPRTRTALYLAAALTLIAHTSLHIFYLASGVAVFWILAHVVWALIRNGEHMLRLGIYALICALGTFALNAYWLIPAFIRAAPLENRFDPAFFEAFAASGNGAIPAILNVAVLGGFWGESQAWRYYFSWPQDSVLFWIASALLWLLALWGAIAGSRSREMRVRFEVILLIFISACAYICALGLADTPFYALNAFLFEHVPLWAGLRDSHKIVSVLSLVLALMSGLGVQALLTRAHERWAQVASFLSVAVFLIPVVSGMYMWGGFRGQLNPVEYPPVWYEAKRTIETLPEGERVLVLPWHGYLSLHFADNRVVANPARVFFGRERIEAGRGIEFDGVRDQEVDSNYRDIDAFVRSADTLSEVELLEGLRARQITHILIIANPSIPDSEMGMTRWTHFTRSDSEVIHEGEETKLWRERLPKETKALHTAEQLVLLALPPDEVEDE